MPAYDPLAWHDLCGAVASAAAALAGLIFVAVSINLRAILENVLLPLRAAEALVVLVSLLLASVFVLVPGQGPVGVGAQVAILGVALLLLTGWGARRRHSRRAPEDPWHWTWTPILIMWVSSVPFVVGGLSTAAGVGGGLYWLVPAFVIGFTGSVFNAWALLVEILR